MDTLGHIHVAFTIRHQGTRTMRNRIKGCVQLAVALGLAAPGLHGAQQFATDDPVIHGIWAEGMERSQTYALSQVLADSIGPRLTGSPGSEAASDWVMKTYESWGIEARRERYGTWDGWARGITHVDLLEPRVRTLEAMMLAWSPATDGAVVGEAVVIPALRSPGDWEIFLGTVAGKFVLISFPQPTCRPDDNWVEFATPESLARTRAEREAAQEAWNRNMASVGASPREVISQIEAVGAAGVIQSRWSEGWGVQKVFSAGTETIPAIDVGCEDYGLVSRLAGNGQAPVLRVEAESQDLGTVDVWNTLGTIRGVELPNEYILLSAHFDTWDGGSGATDNGTGTITMMEAMRILQTVYPQPRRTILVGHWNGEEQGLNGSRAFVSDHPEVVEGLQALFNQDNGTGRVARISMQGLSAVGAYFGKWFAQIPSEITSHISLQIPGSPGGGGSDYASFICAGAPAFSLSSLSWDYGTYTWHTNRDTFDKIVMDDLKNNATLVAMLAYLASEEPDRLPRERSILPPARDGQPREWPACRDGARSSN